MQITLNFNRNESLKALVDSYKERFHLSVEEYDFRLNEWRIVGLMLGNELIGAVCVKEHEGHIGIKKEFRGKWNALNELNRLCKFFEVNRTVVMHDNKKSMRFLERCGWKKTGEILSGVVYVLQ